MSKLRTPWVYTPSVEWRIDYPMRLESFSLNVKTSGTGPGTSQVVRDLQSMYIQIGGSFTGTLQVEVSLNGVDYAAVGAAFTAPGILSVPVPATNIRINTTVGTPAGATACVNGYNVRTE